MEADFSYFRNEKEALDKGGKRQNLLINPSGPFVHVMALTPVCWGRESFPSPGWPEEMAKQRHKNEDLQKRFLGHWTHMHSVPALCQAWLQPRWVKLNTSLLWWGALPGVGTQTTDNSPLNMWHVGRLEGAVRHSKAGNRGTDYGRVGYNFKWRVRKGFNCKTTQQPTTSKKQPWKTLKWSLQTEGGGKLQKAWSHGEPGALDRLERKDQKVAFPQVL